MTVDLRKQRYIMYANLIDEFFFLDFEIFKRKGNYANVETNESIKKFMLLKLSWVNFYLKKNRHLYINSN